MPRVSIVVPTYNRLSLLRETVPTLLQQTENDLEIVIADNASTDGTREWLGSLSDPRLRVESSTELLPQMANWTRAMGLGRSEFVALYHDDDLYHPAIAKRCADVLEANPNVAMVHTAARVFDEGGLRSKTLAAGTEDFVRPGSEEALRWLSEIHDVAPSSTMMRRSAHEKVGGFREDLLCADFEYYVRLALVGDIAFLAEPLLDVRLHRLSTTSGLAPERWAEELETLIPLLRSHVEAAGLEAGDWDERFASLRERFAKRLLQAAPTMLAEDAPDMARRYCDAALGLDDRSSHRRRAAITRALSGSPGRWALRAARKARHAWR